MTSSSKVTSKLLLAFAFLSCVSFNHAQQEEDLANPDKNSRECSPKDT
jgi:hypothetical protein